MHQVRLWIATFLAVALIYIAGPVSAQAPVKQLQLGEKQVEGFIAAHLDMGKVAEKIQSDKPDKAIQGQLESVAKKYGFKDFNEYDDVAANIALVMAGIDPQTKAFTDRHQERDRRGHGRQVDPRKGAQAGARGAERGHEDGAADSVSRQHRTGKEVLRSPRAAAAVAAWEHLVRPKSTCTAPPQPAAKTP
jgi:hypothetical protein